MSGTMTVLLGVLGRLIYCFRPLIHCQLPGMTGTRVVVTLASLGLFLGSASHGEAQAWRYATADGRGGFVGLDPAVQNWGALSVSQLCLPPPMTKMIRGSRGGSSDSNASRSACDRWAVARSGKSS